jgi:hypothetical protein
VASDELKNLQQRRAEQKSLLEEMLKGKTEEERLIIKQKKEYKDISNILKEINEQVKEIQSDNKIVVDNLILQESKLKGLTGIQASLLSLDRARLKEQQTLESVTQDSINSIASMNQELLSMSAEDSIGRQFKQKQINDEIDSLRESGKVNEAILSNLEKQRDIAYQMSGLTEKQQKFLTKQLEVYDGIKDAIGGVLETASLLTQGPAGFFGTTLIGAGFFADKLGEVRSQLGGISDVGTTALSFIDDNAVENAKALSTEFGGMANVSTQLQASTSLISANMGITGGEAASLVGSFARLNGNSTDVALDMTKTTQEFAKQNGIIPSKLMGDLAGSAEEFALFGKDGGDNILQAAGYAQKLGVNMKTISGIADNLLDFESSITKELELSALLGKNINLDKARGLAMSGDLEGATKETLRALGGQAAFNKMDYFQKKASADLLGVSVAELDKMVSNEEEAAKLAGTLAGKFSLAGEAVDGVLNKGLGTSLKGIGGMVIAAGQLNNGFGIFGVNLKGIVSGTAQVLKNLLGMVAGPVIRGVQAIGSSLSGTTFGKGLSSIKEKLLKGVGGGVKPEVPGADVASGADEVSKGKDIGERLKDLAAGLTEMGTAKVLYGALNLIPTAIGFVAILPGLPGMLGVSLLGTGAGLGLEFLGIGLTAMGNTKVTAGAGNLALAAVGFALMTVGVIGLAGIALLGVPAGAGLKALAGGLESLGNAGVAAFKGILLLGLFGVMLIPFTYALSLLAPLVESIGKAIGSVLESIGKGIASIVTSIGDLLVKVLPLLNLEAAVGILAMAAAFTVLAGSLALLSTLGTAAIPVLLAVGAVGAIGSMLIGGDESAGAEDGGEGGSMSALLDEIKGLRADLNSGKVAVYLDGKKVTSTVARVANTSSVNTYAKR